jgi:hypothetical protein
MAKSITENLKDSTWLGIVVNNEDPLFLGRAKIKIFEKFDEIPDENLPWAFPNQSTVFAGKNGYGSFSYPKKNTLVHVRFENGDFYFPIYTVIENINKKMQEEVKESYENAQVLVYDEDEDLKIIYTKNQGLMIWYAGSFVNITPSGADIIEKSPHHYINCPDVQVGVDASHPDTRCDILMDLLDRMAQAIDKKYGVPSACTADVKASKSQVCSDIVQIA